MRVSGGASQLRFFLLERFRVNETANTRPPGAFTIRCGERERVFARMHRFMQDVIDLAAAVFRLGFLNGDLALACLVGFLLLAGGDFACLLAVLQLSH